jgi:hypothetical protein
MARTRSGEDLINDAYLRADLVGAEERHPRDVVLRDVNQGGAELYDLLVEARGRTYFRVTAPTITTLGATSLYALPAAFYRLIAARVAGPGGYCLEPFSPQDEPRLREASATVAKPTHYDLRPGFIEMLPLHTAGTSVIVDYVPVFPDLTDTTTSTFDGINGWEQYLVYFAAREMLERDGRLADVATQDRAMQAMAMRIGKLAPTRDSFRAERVKNVRGRRWL